MIKNVNSDNRFFTAIGAALLLTCTFAASSAFAGSSDDVRMETVKFDDLNLNSDAGVATVYRRIHAAAQRVCAPVESRNLSLVARSTECVAAAEARAVEKVGAPRLSALYEQKTGKALRSIVASN